MRLQHALLMLVLSHAAQAEAQDIATSYERASLSQTIRTATARLKPTVFVEQRQVWRLHAQAQAGSSQAPTKGRMSRKKAVLIGAAIGGGIGAFRGAFYCGGDCGGWSGKAPTVFGLAGAGIGAGAGLAVAFIADKTP